MNRLRHARTWVTAVATSTALLATTLLGTSGFVATGSAAHAAPGASEQESAEPYLVGRGIGDVTGEVAEAGMMGYADTSQVASGLHMRQRARAFVVEERATGDRVLHVNADVGMIFQSVRDAVLLRLQRKYGATYGEANVMLTATHTHAGAGGHSHHTLYNLTTLGYRDKTMRAIVDGIVDAVDRAEADLAPSSLTLTRTHLHNANANRSITAFERNPAADRAHFPDGKDTLSTTVQVHRSGDLVGAINWFPVHATSMTNQNTLVSPDNKGYAGHRWERDHHGVDHLAAGAPEFVASFAQTNAGDMSPNLDLQPGRGPTDDEFENTRIIGSRMVEAARNSPDGALLTGGVDSRIVYVDMASFRVNGEFTPDGTAQRTCQGAFGAAFAAGSTEDGGGGLPIFKEGKDGGNPAVRAIADVLYTASPRLKACQAPKEVLLPVGALDLVQQKLPVQLVRIGDLYLVGMPAEVTVTAGLRLRREVARAVGADLENVLVQGYTNAYGHYVTTPEEYDAGEYEGASTLFGRYQLPAFQQVVHGLATHMDAGTYGPRGEKEQNRSAFQFPSLQGMVIFDSSPLRRRYGAVLTEPQRSYDTGERVEVSFSGAHPNNNLHRDGTYLLVERKDGARWTRVATDGDFETRFEWERVGVSASKVTTTWDVPDDAEPGTYRIRYFGHAKPLLGPLRAFTGTSPTFTVRRGPEPDRRLR